MKSMTHQVPIFLTCLLLLFVFSPPVSSFGEVKIADKELVERQADFERFAQDKVQQLNRNHMLAPSRMKVIKQSDGTFHALFHKIDETSISAKVKRSKSKQIPFVGVIYYKENVFEMSSPTRESLHEDAFSVVKIIPNRHIFSYSQGAWK